MPGQTRCAAIAQNRQTDRASGCTEQPQCGPLPPPHTTHYLHPREIYTIGQTGCVLTALPPSIIILSPLTSPPISASSPSSSSPAAPASPPSASQPLTRGGEKNTAVTTVHLPCSSQLSPRSLCSLTTLLHNVFRQAAARALRTELPERSNATIIASIAEPCFRLYRFAYHK